MREQRRFSAAFKRQVVGELLGGGCTLAQLSRRHDVSSGLILYWKKRYEEAGLAEGPSQSEKRFLARIAELERMVGRLTMENELLKKAVEYSARRRKEHHRSPPRLWQPREGVRSDGAFAQHLLLSGEAEIVGGQEGGSRSERSD